MPHTLSAAQTADALAGMEGWTLTGPGAGGGAAISRTEEFASFPIAIDVVDQVARDAEEMDHHPDIDIRWRTVTFRCTTHSAGGVTELDLQLARRIEAIIEGLRSLDEAA
jgi:4a-hydroxytetrahydrobiopterin dehydratase